MLFYFNAHDRAAWFEFTIAAHALVSTRRQRRFLLVTMRPIIRAREKITFQHRCFQDNYSYYKCL